MIATKTDAELQKLTQQQLIDEVRKMRAAYEDLAGDVKRLIEAVDAPTPIFVATAALQQRLRET